MRAPPALLLAWTGCCHALHVGAQTLLQRGYLDQPPFRRGAFTVREQAGDLCQTHGERQWTGTVDVSSDKRLFYWFFESRGDPETDPIIVWMNGGAGGSSMLGLFTEMGPCMLEADGTTTRPNPHSWNNHASVLFLDQPAGTGLSVVAPGRVYPSSDQEGAVDFQVFLNVFFRDIFPAFRHHPIHLAAESYGGHYAPTYLQHILTARALQSSDAFWGNVTSIVLVNGLLDAVAASVGSYELLCTPYRAHRVPLLPAAACADMAHHLPECIRLGRLCRQTSDSDRCRTAADYCSTHVDRYFADEYLSGRRSPFNVQRPCPSLPLCHDPAVGNHATLLSQPRVLARLGYSPAFVYDTFNLDLNAGFDSLSGDMYKPQSPRLTALLDLDPVHGHAPLRLLLLNGNDDWAVNTPGQAWLLDRLPWSGQADFCTAPWHSWPAVDDDDKVRGAAAFAGAGYWKQTPDARLVLVGVDGAGHEVPRLQGAAAWDIMQRWLGGWR